MHLTLERLPSPIGAMLLASDGEVLRALIFDDDDDEMATLLRRQYRQVTLTMGRVPEAISGPVKAYFSGELDALDTVPVATGGTAFQRRVWAALRTIPTGVTTSYGALAASLGQPGASRAVGLANGANPICLVVPCHRVIGADGTLTGYGGGLHRKEWLLRHEGVRLTLPFADLPVKPATRQGADHP